MKKLLTAIILSSFTFAGQVNFNYRTVDADQNVKNYINKLMNEKCSEAFSDVENVVTVVDLEIERIDQGMELEYKATVEVVEDYGHSPAKKIVLEFDEERYHGEDFWFFRLTEKDSNFCTK